MTLSKWRLVNCIECGKSNLPGAYIFISIKGFQSLGIKYKPKTIYVCQECYLKSRRGNKSLASK